MRTEVTKKWLRDQKPCSDGFEYWIEQYKPDLFDFTKQCIKDNNFEWADWLMVRCMDRKQYLRYALYAVKQVEPTYRKRNPDSTIITGAIKAVKACIRDDSKENREFANAAAKTADATVDFSDVCVNRLAINVAANIADAANIFYDAASYVDSAVCSAASYAAFYAADSYAVDYDSPCDKEVYKTVYTKLIRYGMRIMKEKQK